MDRNVQRLLQDYFPRYIAEHRLPGHVHKAVWQLRHCRSSKLGYSKQFCPAGHFERIWYHSCRHRFCDRCNGLNKERWLQRQSSRFLRCAHHHIVFTLPHEFNALWCYNRKLMASIFYEAVSKTLLQLCRQSRWLGGDPGMIITLHTWGRSLSFHPHLHVLMTAGGLDHAGQWQDPKRSCLLPSQVVMQVFRGKWRALTIKALKSGALRRPPHSSSEQVMSSLNKWGRKKWNVYFCQRYEYGNGVLKYLSRYVRGGPLKSRQLIFKDGRVSLLYQPHHQSGSKQTPFQGDQLVGRYLQHLPVPRQHSVRYYGLYTPRAIERLNRARSLLGQETVVVRPTLEWTTYLAQRCGITEYTHCPTCGLTLTSIPSTPQSRAPPKPHS